MSAGEAAAEHWRRVQAVLDAALAHSPDKREAAIAAACGDDADLRDEALALLRHADALPERVPDAALAGWLDDETADPRHWVGRDIGVFVLEECIGRGGSSLVFRARRRDGFAQRVAIKLLHGIGVPARRFLRERDVLADLRHPNIARLHDAGSTPEGMPYLVLEYIEGQRWDRALAARRPSLRQRLGDVAVVCDAIAYAHQHLCVHRDIKPANLMIDADGAPRLLDFGIAKLLDASTDAATELTRDFGTPLTPAYAAPEQIRGEAATTATDIYALGVLLYETLTGANPFQRAGASTGDVLRAVAEGEVLRPSECLAQRLAAIGDEASGQAPPPIRPAALRGDLDNIVASAMAKDPARRYASARHLADDLRAWLDGRPVLARAPTWRYIAGKFARRHRTAVVFAGLALIALVATLGAALWQAREAQRARDLAEERLVAMRGFVTTVLFDYHEGIQQLEGSLPLQQRMVGDALGYLEALRRSAGEDTSLWLELAAGYMKTGDTQGNPYASNLGDFAGAAESYAMAHGALDRAVELGADRQKAQLQRARLLARDAHLLHQAAKLDASAARYREALAQFATLPEHDALDVVIDHANTLDEYGDLLGRDGTTSLADRAGAEAAQQQARGLRTAALQRHPDEERLRLALYNSELREAEHLMGRNDMAAAEAALQRALASIRALHEAKPEDAYRRREVALVLSRMVPVQDALGRLDDSIASARQAFDTMETMFARDPGNDAMRVGVIASAGWFARQLVRAKQFEAAGPVIDRQIGLDRERLQEAPDDPERRWSLALAYRRLGEQRAGLQDHVGAIAAHRDALALQAPLVDLAVEYRLGHALSLSHLGRAELSAGRVTDARQHLRTAADTLRDAVAAHPDAGRYREDQADALGALAQAWRAGTRDCVSAGAAEQEALVAWETFAAAAPLPPAQQAKRDALVEAVALQDCNATR